jgi:hypothetical protein
LKSTTRISDGTSHGAPVTEEGNNTSAIKWALASSHQGNATDELRVDGGWEQ